MKMFKRSSIATLLVASGVSAAIAQEQGGVYRTESGVEVVPGLISNLYYDDNVIRDRNATISSMVATLAPSIKATINDGANSYSFATALKAGNYFDSSNDNYLDGYLETEAKLSPSSAHNFKVRANASWLHEDRGTGVTEGRGNLLGDVTKFHTETVAGDYEYGRPGATGKLRANARYYSRTYDNFRTLTQYRDFDSNEIGAGFVYQTASVFKLVAEAKTADIEYKVTDLSGSRDNQDSNFKLGAEWELTAMTTGAVKVGYQKKDFDLAARENFSGVAWEAIVQWQPLTYSGFDFSTGRRAKDVDALNINADFIEESTYAVGWKHQWSSFFDSKLAYQYQTEDYNLLPTATTAVAREDKIKILTAELNYKPLRWLTVTGYVNAEDRTSTAGIIEYDRNVYGLSFKMTL